MRKREYIRKINKSSLIIIPEKDCGTERDSIEMFRYNHIPYFLNMEEQRKDIHLQFCYDITSRRSLEQLLEYKSLDYALLQMILYSLDQACMQTEDFMITENDILLEAEFIFTDHNMEQMSYCYLPGNQEDICMQFKGFMEYLLQHLDHKDEQAVQLAYGVYQRVAEERTALHSVLKENGYIKNLSQSTLSDWMSFNKSVYQTAPERTMAGGENDRQSLAGQGNERQISASRESENRGQWLSGQEPGNRGQWFPGQESENRGQWLSGQESGNSRQISDSQISDSQGYENEKQSPDSQISVWKETDGMKTEKKISREALKGKMKKAEQIQEGILAQNTDQTTKIQQKETLRKQAAEKLKNMLRKKLYTDRARYAEENTVFEADEEEPVFSNPTVCLMPETDKIQNQFVYQGADRSRDFQCMQGKLLLGSDLEESDIYIPIPMISRVHARVEIDAQGTFIEDMNSTNGTHVNGELLQYREKRMLQKGDIVSLAGECYSFH